MRVTCLPRPRWCEIIGNSGLQVHRSLTVATREHEAIAVEPLGILGVVLQEVGVEHSADLPETLRAQIPCSNTKATVHGCINRSSQDQA